MRQAQQGITLVELMVVVLIIGIITAAAVPSYRQYSIRTNRTDAKVALTSAAAALERCFARLRAYDSEDCDATVALETAYDAGTYRIMFIGEPTATSFGIQAIPQDGQAEDKKCGTFTITQDGTKGLLGGTHTDSAANCWKR